MNRNDAAMGETVVRMLCAGRFGEAYEHFGTSLRALLSLENLIAAWHREIGPGATPGAAEDRDGVVAVPVLDREATILMSVVRGKLSGLRIARDVPPWQPPHYVDSAAFDEEEIDLETAAGPVPGTVSVPRRRAARHPAVVLLSGGGPFDRDGTAGANKTMKDIAWGLATGGVVVLRFDKPSHLEAARGGDWADITPTADYVPPAVAAVRALRARADVDPCRVFVLGHSLGGRYAPRVAAAEPAIAGVILLAADTQPMQRAAVRVARYLMTVAPESARAMLPDPEDPLYAVIHEACYADGQATRWSAQRTMPEELREDPTLFTGEHVFPSTFEDDSELAPLAKAADLLAEHVWPALYDPQALASCDVPAAAAVYAHDAYVDRAFSEETVALVPGLRGWVTDEYEHNGLRADGARILDRLFSLAHSRVG